MASHLYAPTHVISSYESGFLWPGSTPGHDDRADSNLPVDLTGEVTGKRLLPSSLGTFSDVWKCVKRCSGGSETFHVAVKPLRMPNNDLIAQKAERLRSKVREWMGLQHEAVLPILGFVCDFGPLPALVSPWLDGGNLTRYLEANPDMSLDQRLHLLQQIAEGLDYRCVCPPLDTKTTNHSLCSAFAKDRTWWLQREQYSP